MPFSTICSALFYPYIAHERTAQNLILSVCSMLFALFLKERHPSKNQGSQHRGMVTRRNILHRGMATRRCILHRGVYDNNCLLYFVLFKHFLSQF